MSDKRFFKENYFLDVITKNHLSPAKIEFEGAIREKLLFKIKMIFHM